MSIPEPVTAVPEVSSAVTPPEPTASGTRSWLAWALAVAVLLALAALIWAAWLSQRLALTQETMARRSADTQAEAAAARQSAAQAEAYAKDLVARLGVVELRLSEVSLQRSQLEELMLSVSRSRDDSLVQDLESALRLAIQQSQLTGSVQPLISALQGAEQRIERAAQPRLNPVQRAIARDIERLRTAQLMDVPALVSRMDELLRGVDEWPLRNAPLSTLARSPEALSEVSASEPSTTEASAPEEAPADARTRIERQWLRWSDWVRQTGQRWWQAVREGSADLLRVSRIDHPEAALLAPDQSYLLREHIKLKLLHARLGLLGRQSQTAQDDVAATRQLVERYFDDSAPATRTALQTLAQLQQDLRSDALPRPDETLGALAVAAGGR
jgi:uroporphyrin-III C-methyltransferase